MREVPVHIRGRRVCAVQVYTCCACINVGGYCVSGSMAMKSSILRYCGLVGFLTLSYGLHDKILNTTLGHLSYF